MLLALARIVTTKVVLRPEGQTRKDAQDDNKWDFLFHQSGMIGSAILSANGNCGSAAEQFPPKSLGDTFAVSFVTSGTHSPDATEHAKNVVSKIAKLKVDRAEFDE